MNIPFIQKFLHRPVAISMFYGALVVGGVFAFWRLPLDLAPEVEFPALTINTSWGSTSAETVEMFITSPIEEISNTILGVRKVSSVSGEGKSSVDIEFEQKTDMNFARLELNEKLAALTETLPAGVSPPRIQRYIPKDFQNLQGFLSYSLSGSLSTSILRRYGEETIAPTLLSIKGIANVQVYGGEREEIHIEIDPAKALAYKLNTEIIALRLREYNFNASVGSLVGNEKRTIISIRNNSSTKEEIKNLIVSDDSMDNFIRLRDVAHVTEGLSEPTSFYRINGNSSVTIIIDKEPNVNILQVANAVYAKIELLSKQFPSGVKLIKESDKSEELRKELARFYREILISLFCILVVLTFFLRTLKASFLILSSILFSLSGTLLLFWLFDIGLNLLTLAGLVLGFGRLVDDSIVVLENIHRKLEENDRDRYTLISRSIDEIALPVVASTITTIGALLPLKFLPQDLRPYFLQFGQAVGISLMMSLLVSFTLIPVVSGRIELKPMRFRLFERIGIGGLFFYRKTLSLVFRKKFFFLALVIWMFGLPLWLMPEKIEAENIFASLYNKTFGSETYLNVRSFVNNVTGGVSHLFFSKVVKGEIWDFGLQTFLIVRVGFPQGTEIERYNQIATVIEKEVLLDSIGVEKITTRVSNEYAVVRIDIKETFAKGKWPLILKNRIIMLGAQTGGSTISVYGYGPGFYSGGESSPRFTIKILGYNYDRVKKIAEQFRQTIERNPRIEEVDIDRTFGRWNNSYELVININRDVVARNNLTVADILHSIRTYTSGAVNYNTLDIKGKLMPYVIKFKGYKNFSVNDLRNIVITNRKNESIKLSDNITVNEKRTPGEIYRENQQYIRWVSFDFKGPYRIGENFMIATIKAMSLPSGYSIERAYSFFWLSDENQSSFLWIAFFGSVIVFMVTASLYESFLKPFIVILSVPFSLIGLFLSFYVMDVPFGRGGYASVILLVGIVVTNSVVLVDHISHMIEVSGFSTEVILDACSHRLRPILMTSLTTIGGLMPLLLIGDETSLWYQLSLGTIGGMISSTLLTLIVLPVVYAALYSKIRFNSKL